MLGIISSVKDKGFSINTMSLKIWYKYLLEVNVTHTESEDTSVLVPCRAEQLAPIIDWGRSWWAVCVPGLSPVMRSFLWRLLYEALKSEIPDITLERIRYLDFQSEDLLAPTYLTAAKLLQIWSSRTSVRRVSWLSVRANVEQSILTLR